MAQNQVILIMIAGVQIVKMHKNCIKKIGLIKTESSSVWLESPVWGRAVAGSIPVFLTVTVAQLVERKDVALVVADSSSVSHP